MSRLINKRTARTMLGGALLPFLFALPCHGQAQALPARLDLESAVRMALERNFRVRIDSAGAQAAATAVSAEAGAFDPLLDVSANTFDDAFETGLTDVVRAQGNGGSAALRGRLPTGTEYSVGVDSTEFAEADPSRLTRGVAQLRQPLLRGVGIDVNMAGLRIARKNAAASAQGLAQTVTDVVTDTQFAYFDVLLAQENVRVARESLDLARKLMDENRERVTLGSLAESDMLQAEAEVALREEALYNARQLEVQAVNRLRGLLAESPDRALRWDFTLAPLPEPVAVEVDPRRDYPRALEQRPDYRQAVLGLDRSQIEELRASNMKMPALDLVGRASWYAAGSTLENTFNRLGDDRQDPAYNVGLVFSVPLPNRTARAEALRARLQTRAQELTLRQLERDILLALDDAAQRIHNGWQRLQSARRSRELAERALAAEQERFQIGTSSTFVLIRLQTDLASARVRQLLVLNEYRKAIVEYARQGGLTLVERGIQVSDLLQE